MYQCIRMCFASVDKPMAWPYDIDMSDMSLKSLD